MGVLIMFLTILFGVAVGLFSGVFGLGAGVIIIPVLMFVFGMGVREAIGTSLCIIVPTALSGAIKHFRLGNIPLNSLLAAALIALGAVVAAPIGASIATKLNPLLLKRVVGIVIVVLAIRMIIGK